MLANIRNLPRDILTSVSRRSVIIPLLCAITVLCITLSISSINTYIVYDGNRISVLNSNVTRCSAALDEMGIVIESNDSVNMPAEPEGGVARIRINRTKEVTVNVDGKAVVVHSSDNETISELLSENSIQLARDDLISVPLTSPVTDGMSIDITRIAHSTIEERTDIPFKKIRRANNSLASGKEKTVQTGAVGATLSVYSIETKNGTEVSRKLISQTVVSQPIDNIIEYGTKEADTSGTVKTSAGVPLKYKKVINVTATAYSTERWSRKTTATGQVARVGLIAVDPKVIPIGTKMYITSSDGKSWVYGTAVAADTGGSIKGNKVDLFFDTHNECIRFGRRNAKIYILG